jgi:flagellar biosynthesis/type III secretory pathway protein FliH
MMTAHLYTDFGDREDVEYSKKRDGIEDEKLESFELGYQAGWEDAIRAHSKTTEKVFENLCRSVEDISLHYNEENSKALLRLKPMLTDVVTKLLPVVADRSLTAHITKVIFGLIEHSTASTIEVAVCSNKRDHIEQLLKEKLTVPIKVIGEDSLTALQAYIRVSETHQEVDLASVVTEIMEATEAFFDQLNLEKLNE